MINMFLDKYSAILEDIDEHLGIMDTVPPRELSSDPLGEIEFLSQSGSVVRCLRSVVSTLQTCGPSPASRLLADVVEYGERCAEQISAGSAELPTLRKEAASHPSSGEAHAALGFALSHLGDEKGAEVSFRNALQYAKTDALCFVCHRDCLNNLGWQAYLARNYEQALIWFDQACWMSPDSTDVVHGLKLDELQPPYRLAFENILLSLARLRRTSDAQKYALDYCRWFGRLPRYESLMLSQCGINADRIYLDTRLGMVSIY